jgi:hypothetical protein
MGLKSRCHQLKINVNQSIQAPQIIRFCSQTVRLYDSQAGKSFKYQGFQREVTIAIWIFEEHIFQITIFSHAVHKAQSSKPTATAKVSPR